MSISHIYLGVLTRHLHAGSDKPKISKNICGLSLFPYDLTDVSKYKDLGEHTSISFTIKPREDPIHLTGLFHKNTLWWPTKIEKGHLSHHQLMEVSRDLTSPARNQALGIEKHQFYFSEAHAAVNQPCFLRVDEFQNHQILVQIYKGKRFVHEGNHRFVPHILEPQGTLLLHVDDIETGNPTSRPYLRLNKHSMRLAQWRLVTHPPREHK